MASDSSAACTTSIDFELMLEAIRQRFALLTDKSCQRQVFLNHMRTMAVFGDEPADYVVPEAAELPKELEIAYAVCHPACGNQALVVIEGGPQNCDCCGGTMLPVTIGTYRMKGAPTPVA